MRGCVREPTRSLAAHRSLRRRLSGFRELLLHISRYERILRCRIHWAAGYATAGFMQNAQLSAARGFDRGLQHYKLFI